MSKIIYLYIIVKQINSQNLILLILSIIHYIFYLKLSHIKIFELIFQHTILCVSNMKTIRKIVVENDIIVQK